MAKVININKKDYFVRVMEEALEFERQGLVTDFVLTYRRDYTEEEKREGKDTEAGMTCRYWFGETSSIFCLGLWSNMRHIIEHYIEEEDLIAG